MEILKDKLICIACGKPLVQVNNCLQCTNCSKTYPVVNNIPVIIDDDESLFDTKSLIAGQGTYFNHNNRKKIKFIPSISWNFISKKNYSRISGLFSCEKNNNMNVLIIGGSVKGEGLDEILGKSGFRVITSDVFLGDNVDIVFDSHKIPFEENLFDLVIIQAVLEHVLFPEIIVKEIYRVLNEDGYVYSEVPFIQHVHGGKYDFRRYTHLGHQVLFSDFKIIESDILCGPAMAFTWSIENFFMSFFNKIILIRAARLFSKMFWFLKYLDIFLVKNIGAYNSASAFYVLAQKKKGYKTNFKELLDNFKGY